VIIALFSLPVLVFSLRGLTRERLQFCWNCQNINEVQVEFGRWVERSTKSDATVLVNDAGAIRYFGNRRTIDLIGLNEKRFIRDRLLQARIATNPNELASFMESERADYLIIFSSWFQELIQHRDFSRLFTPIKELRSENYTISAAPQQSMVAFFRNQVAKDSSNSR
jgi:hypothetical protein